MPPTSRWEEDLWAEFMTDYPRILGGRSGRGRRPACGSCSTVKLAELERMADFTRWAKPSHRRSAGRRAPSYPPIAATAAAQFRGAGRLWPGEGDCEPQRFSRPIQGNLTQLLQALADYTGSGRLTIPGWPKTPNVAATELRRIAPLLRVVGLSVTFERGANGTRLVSITSLNRDGVAAARRA